MNKSALKTFATNARRELLKKVEARAMKIGITEDIIKKADIESSDAIFIDGRQLSKEEKTQRDRLIDRINQIGFKRVMEEVAYTWFNRFTALRFMEVNDYLPTKVRVLSSTNPDSTEPDMIKEALSLDLDLDLDKEYIYELKMNNKSEELFKYLIIKHCNDLNRYMPFMFETIDDYTEILFPEGLLATDSFVRHLTNTEVIPEDNWEEIEVIGWLYQYYIAEEKDRVFKEKKKYKAEEIPFATQLFTPNWIVRYMVQNSLGRYWLEAHPEHRELLNDWEFYLEHEQEDFQEKIAPYVNKVLKVEDIKCLDPAMGSGHILVYAFDVFYEIYSKCGYMEREIPRLIIENNLYGLDIDDRAYQLACFSIVMKALKYNRRFLRSIEREGITLNLASIQETNHITDDDILFLAGKNGAAEQVKKFIRQFHNAKIIGSLLKLEINDISYVQERLKEIEQQPVSDLFESEKREKLLTLLPNLLKQTKIMQKQYDIVVTNPPYMSSGSMNSDLYQYLQLHYPDSKLDTFTAFMEINHFLKESAYYSCINQHSWLFLSSYEKLRKKIIEKMSIINMIHLGPRTFEEISGEVVQSTSFVMRNTKNESEGIYINLTKARTANDKKTQLKNIVKVYDDNYVYKFKQEKCLKIPGNPIAYWLNDRYFKLFKEYRTIENYVEAKAGVVTGNDKYFVRFWHEVNFRKVEKKPSKGQPYSKYHLMSKGGSHKRFYGNIEYVIKLRDLWDPTKTNKSVRRGDKEFYFKKAIGWSQVGNSQKSFRIVENSVCGTATPTIYLHDDKHFLYFLGFLNSKIALTLLNIFNQTMNLLSTDICSLPIIIDERYLEKIDELTKDSINISKADWDSFETSIDFKTNPLIKMADHSNLIKSAFAQWNIKAAQRITNLKQNEEKLNELFIKIYGLENDINPEVQKSEITIHAANLERDMKSFISYAIGCSLGRYSLDEEGLVYAGGEFDPTRYKTVPVDQDNILPILPGAYFEDDIVSRFVNFVRVTFGDDTLSENLDFVADTLGRKKGETSKDTIRRYFINDFYKDHVQTYKNRPIYWLFTSGKEKAFNCLIYMHRYDKTTLSRIRTDYLHEYQIRLDAEKKDLLNIINRDSTAKEISNAKKELKSLDKKIEELKAYDELLHHMADMQIEIDLDDGVKVNYEKFKGLVAKI